MTRVERPRPVADHARARRLVAHEPRTRGQWGRGQACKNQPCPDSRECRCPSERPAPVSTTTLRLPLSQLTSLCAAAGSSFSAGACSNPSRRPLRVALGFQRATAWCERRRAAQSHQQDHCCSLLAWGFVQRHAALSEVRQDHGSELSWHDSAAERCKPRRSITSRYVAEIVGNWTKVCCREPQIAAGRELVFLAGSSFALAS